LFATGTADIKANATDLFRGPPTTGGNRQRQGQGRSCRCRRQRLQLFILLASDPAVRRASGAAV
jgi:hypothetical protein